MKTEARSFSPGVKMDRKGLPVLKTCDVVVTGGSFAGVAAALEIARAGRKVVVVEPRTYLGREVTATLRPWVHVNETLDNEKLSELIKACIDKTGSSCEGQNEIPLHMDAVKTVLEDLLIEAGVELVYASLPVGLSDDGDKKNLIIGNKSGRQIVECQMVLDATENATVARLSGGFFVDNGHKIARYHKTIEFYRVHPLREMNLTVPEEFGIAGHTVNFHQGYKGDGHIFAEFALDFRDQDSIESGMSREIESRHKAMKLASYLMNNITEFEEAAFVSTSYELDGPGTGSLSDSLPKWAEKVSEFNLQDNESLTIGGFAGPVRHLWCLSEAARVEEDRKEWVRNPVDASCMGTALAKGLIDHWDELLAVSVTDEEDQDDFELMNLEVKELDSPKRGGTYRRSRVSPETIPVLRETEVLVVGGGTSGATAATVAAQEGAKTVLLEMNPGLGGTGTLGGVDSYWFGRRLGFNQRLTEKVEEAHEAIRHTRNKWNIEAKMYVLIQGAERAGVETFFNAITTGVLMDGNRVKGVVVATRWGLFAIAAETVIDATGDGDVAVYAGADYVYGSSRDHVSMWYSLAQFSTPGLSRNNFTSMVDVSNIEDYTRAILAGRRRKRDDNCHDHGIYVATRESRHVLGDTVMTQTDQLVQKQWADVINIHFSNTDIKGKSQSNWIHLGLIPPNLEVEVPYRILLPKGIDGLLVAGKAMSATHDAFAVIRMQADLENLGGIVGIASAMAVRNGQTPRELVVTELQKRIVSEGMLPADVLDRKIEEPRNYSNEELKRLVESLADDKPLYAYSDMDMSEVFHDRIPLVEVCTAGSSVIPILEQELPGAEGVYRLRLAQALAWYQSPAAVPVLAEEIEKQLEDGGEGLPLRDSHIRYAGEPPDQGAMPDTAYLIYTLGLVPDKRNLIVWDQIADRLDAVETDISDGTKGLFYYVDAVCFGIERLADPEAVPILEKIYRHDAFREQTSGEGFQVAHSLERQAMLELSIARAKARCGSPKGAEVLIGYLTDVRALLAEQAHKELASISGKDFGKDARLWTEWLEEVKDDLQPCPVIENFD
ncbi:MAG TPA: FAD-dependent oxidoreductase [Bacillales bacterium]|nr:FAD-dependent oxidoreductase [Bacillales bacterium]